ncbi:BLUF domain-containing protein [Maricaulaceae bacterium MS644]
MFRVAYRSTLDSGVGEAEIESIVARAAQKNAQAGIAGVWLLAGRRILSAIEGDPREVREVVEKIWDDPRHDAFTLLDMGASEVALFNAPFQLIRTRNVADDPSLLEHPGVRWLCDFAGGADAFFFDASAQSQSDTKA